MKYVVFISDGCADVPAEALGGKTPLEAAAMPLVNGLCRMGETGLAVNVPQGVPPGSDTAILSIFGNDPRVCYTGRSPLEAAGCGVPLTRGEFSFRTNVVALSEEEPFEEKRMLSHSGGGIEGEASIQLMTDLLADAQFAQMAAELGLRFKLNPSYRHIAILRHSGGCAEQKPPHDILGQRIGGWLCRDALSMKLQALQRRAFEVLSAHPINAARIRRGLLPANCIWPWGGGSAVILPDFVEKYHRTAAVISAVPLVQGIGTLMGLPSIPVEGATGEIDTNYEGKANAAADALAAGTDLVFIHVEAPDECAHAGDAQGKVRALEYIDQRCVKPLVERMAAIDDFRLLYLSDHPTLLTTRTHDGAPVPYFIYDSRKADGCGLDFSEANAARSGIAVDGTALLERLFEQK